MAPRVRDELSSGLGVVEQILPRSEINRVVEEHLTGRNEHSVRIWSLLALNAWMKRTLQ